MRIEFSNDSKKSLKKLDTTLRNRILNSIEKLQENPIPKDAKRIIGVEEQLFRIRIGKYRVLYEFKNEVLVIFIVNIDKRSRIYRDL